jgi:hypothetical protein
MNEALGSAENDARFLCHARTVGVHRSREGGRVRLIGIASRERPVDWKVI